MNIKRNRPNPRSGGADPAAPQNSPAAAADSAPAASTSVNESDGHERVRIAAYFLAERRGFAPGHELEDWLAAETTLCAVSDDSAAARSETPSPADRVPQRASPPRSPQQPGDAHG